MGVPQRLLGPVDGERGVGLEVLEEGVVLLRRYGPIVESFGAGGVLDERGGCAGEGGVVGCGEGEPALFLSVAGQAGMFAEGGGGGVAVPGRQEGGAPVWFVGRGRCRRGLRREFGEIRVDGAEVRVEEGEAGRVDGVCGDDEVFL